MVSYLMPCPRGASSDIQILQNRQLIISFSFFFYFMYKFITLLYPWCVYVPFMRYRDITGIDVTRGGHNTQPLTHAIFSKDPYIYWKFLSIFTLQFFFFTLRPQGIFFWFCRCPPVIFLDSGPKPFMFLLYFLSILLPHILVVLWLHFFLS